MTVAGGVPGFFRQTNRPNRFGLIVEAVSARDRAWFDEHPDATRYVRSYVPGEFWPSTASAEATVIVTCYRDPSDGSQLLRTRQVDGETGGGG